MSTINTNGIDGNYPTPGKNNSSEGFRNNFTAIKNNLNTAGTEITELQDKAVLKQALNNITLDNNMANTLISNAAIRTFRNTTYNLGNNVSGTVVVNCTLGDVQTATITGDTTFQFAGWAPTATRHTIALDLTIANTTANIFFPGEVSQGGSILENNSVDSSGNLVIATAPYGVTELVYNLSTIDCGNSILITPTNRDYQSSQIEERSAMTPTGYQGDRNGDVAVTTAIQPQSVTATSSTGDLMTTDNTTGFYINMPIEFTGSNGNTVYGGVSAGTDYFITSLTANTNFSVSTSEGGANVTLTNVTSTMQVSPIKYQYLCTGTYDSTTTVANVAQTFANNYIDLSASKPDVNNYGLNQPIVFSGPDLAAGGLVANTTYYITSVNTAGNTLVSVSRTRTNGVAGPNVSLTANSTAFTNTTGTVYTQGHDIWKRVKLDSF
jgi:hypothetical protein